MNDAQIAALMLFAQHTCFAEATMHAVMHLRGVTALPAPESLVFLDRLQDAIEAGWTFERCWTLIDRYVAWISIAFQAANELHEWQKRMSDPNERKAHQVRLQAWLEAKA